MKLQLENDGCGTESLLSAYQMRLESTKSEGIRAKLDAMLRVIPRIATEITASGDWYCSISHDTLCFLRHEDVLVSLSSLSNGKAFAALNGYVPDDTGEYDVTFLIPPGKTPWPKARTSMHAQSVPDAIRALQIAFDEWRD